MMHLDARVGERFPGISTAITKIEGMRIKEAKGMKVQLPYTREEVDDLERLKQYRSFFWKVGIDPLLIKPPQEELILRALEGEISSKNALMEACDIVSVRHRIPLMALNSKKVSSGLVLRMAEKEETFMDSKGKEKQLKGKELVLADSERVLMLYPYEKTKDLRLKRASRECLLLACGVPGIQKEFVVACLEAGYRMVVQKCGGSYKGIAVLAR